MIVTGDQDRHLALEMIGRGVSDVLHKPVDPPILQVVIARALERAELERELQQLRDEVRERYSFGNLVGQSPAMRKLFATLVKLAATSTSVLVLGESGTGKSAIARALHHESPRAGGPFVVVDGAAMPEALLESELFGHTRGAYTGATSQKAGRIEMAQGGTLFLDEIGNLSLSAQSKLLLFLDSSSYTPVGSNEEIRVDVRLIAATNANLAELTRRGAFRPDLLYRIQVATVVIPPLRERKEDIGPLAQFLLASIGRELGRPAVRLSADAVSRLEEFPWPGNVRQLKHALENSLVLLDGDVLAASELVLPPPWPAEPAAPDPAPPDPTAPVFREGTNPGFKKRVAAFEREILQDVLRRTGGNKAQAARLLGLDENQIHYLCRKHGMH